MKSKLDIAIIGGGAAGFFAAINCKLKYPDYNVTIYEKSNKVLSKVKVSGGGRCNVTNATESISEFSKNYPRGQRQLKSVFGIFNQKDTIKWFEERGIELVTQSDLCIFPKSQNSQTIIDCFLKECNRLKIEIKTGFGLTAINTGENEKLTLDFRNHPSIKVDKLIVAIGGQPKLSGLELFKAIGHSIVTPVPSLFTFNMPKENISNLMGIVVESASVKIQSTKLENEGPLLITHWGMSGPAILKLSAWGARILHDKNYKFKIQINWLKKFNYNDLEFHLKNEIKKFSKKKVGNQKIVQLPTRLWDYLLEKIELNRNKKWSELSKKEFNRLVNIIQNDEYQVEGKTTFKEEFVTCGGISLGEINFKSMASKINPNIYFAGEVLDIDGITGGFNFQNAWSTAFLASQLK
ncbi:MAG: NAD(P)/FAD-dependent oxidoreductase [Putridiphycobacter sp.]